MEEKKQTQIGQNVSSGAEKVEKITQEKRSVGRVERQGEPRKSIQKTTRKTAEKRHVSGVTPQTGAENAPKQPKTASAVLANKKAEKESRAAKSRVAAAIKKKEEKQRKKEERAKAKAEKRAAIKAKREARAKRSAEQRKADAAKRKEERKALAEKRRAERKALAEKRIAERKALEEKRKAEKEEKRRERAHKKANRMQAKNKARAKKQTQKTQRKANGNQNRGGKKGYGGWLAAVIALGATTLALTTVVTVGAMEMNKATENAVAGYRATTYELIGIMENVDNDLDRARISASAPQQERILTDLLVQSRLAELDLEKLPVEMENNKNLTSFINRVGAVSERLLAKLRHGEPLTAADEATLQRLYETSHAVRAKMDEYAANMCDEDFKCYMKKGEGNMANVVADVEELTLEENRLAQTEGAGTRRIGAGEPKTGAPKLQPAQAEELCKRYFSAYRIDEYQCVGETVARGFAAYNVQGYDDNGTLLFAEIDNTSGELVRFDYFEPCSEEKFDTDNAKRIADAFLARLGYDDMTAVRVRDNGTDTDFTYVYETDGVLYYPDTVKIKVCRARGVVTGMDAERYLRNHERRVTPEPALNLEQAQAKLRTGLNVENANLAVVRTARGERSAYEFICSYQDERYFIYLDANSGEEIAIVNVKNVG